MSLRTVVLRSFSTRAPALLLPRLPLSFQAFTTSQQLRLSTSTPSLSFIASLVPHNTQEGDEDQISRHASEQQDVKAEPEPEVSDERLYSQGYGPADMMRLEEWRVQKGTVGRTIKWIKGPSQGPDHVPSHTASLVVGHEVGGKMFGPIKGEMGEKYKFVQQRLAHMANVYLGLVKE